MDEHELKVRLKQFGARAMRLGDALPRSRSGNAVGNPLVRCATSVGANYHAACRAPSRADFVAKLGICEEKADETGYCLEMMRPVRIEPLLEEADEVLSIMIASRKTAMVRMANQKSKTKKQKSA